jgi:hypothetical protein
MIFNWKTSVTLAVASAWLVGCGAQPESGTGPAVVDKPPPATVDAHAHPSHGPHEGELIELGNEEFHAELLHDAKSVTIYILDAAAKTAVPIEATEITINVQHEGQPEQFSLAAAPDTGDPAGKSSKFTSQDAELAEHVEDEGSNARLVVTINGQQYNGAIVHDHGEGHAHEH